MNNNLKSEFNKNGYIVLEKLIPETLADKVIDEFEGQIRDSEKHFFRQNLNYWTKNKKNKYGFVEDSFLDPHEYNEHASFMKAVRNILMNDTVLKALQEITGEKEISLMQSMFFDLNTATWPHTDNYYLDSIPNGFLLGAWFALEDIKESAGRFYVVGGSNKDFFNLSETEKISDEQYRKKIKNYLDKNHLENNGYNAPALKKGDVLFWSSKTIHGSFPTKDESVSRRSLTAHYMPSKYKYGNLNGEFPDQPFFDKYNDFNYRVDTKKYSALNNFKVKLSRTILNQFPNIVKLKRSLFK